MTTTDTTARTTPKRRLDFKEIDNIAIGACPGVLQHFAPDGKVRGSEWDAMCPARKHKELGTFKFNFAGPRAGAWADFGAGEAGHGVIAYARYCLGVSMREAAEAVADYLCIGSTSPEMPRPRQAHAPRPLQKPAAELGTFDPATPVPQIPREDGRGFIKTTASWLYRNAEGNGVFFIVRTTGPDGKGFRQIFKGPDGEWKFRGLSGVTPLYKLPDLLAKPDAPVMFVEGEKTADAAARLFPEFAVVTSRGGASNVPSTDASPLRGRSVFVIGDADEAGRRFSAAAFDAARAAGAVSVDILTPPSGVPAGWDLADPFPDGVQPRAWLDAQLSPAEPVETDAEPEIEEVAEPEGDGSDNFDALISFLDGQAQADEDDGEVLEVDTLPASSDVKNVDFNDEVHNTSSGHSIDWTIDGDVGVPGWRTMDGRTQRFFEQVSKKGEVTQEWRDVGPAARVVAFAATESGDHAARLVEILDRRGRVVEVLVEDALLSEQSLGALARRFAEAGAPIDPAKSTQLDFARYLLLQAPDVEARIVERSGWHGDEYLMPDFRPLGTSHMRHLPPPDQKRLTGYKTSGDLDGWWRTLKLTEGNTRMVFSVCVSLAAPLLKELRGENTVFHLFGDSGDGKTTALRLGASVWGNPDRDRDVVSSWRATDASLERVALCRSDNCVFLDELSEANSATVRDSAYLLGNGRTKEKATTGGEARYFRIIGLSTGEVSLEAKIKEAPGRPIDLHEGAKSRFVDIPSVSLSGSVKGIVERLNGPYAFSRDVVKALDAGISKNHGHAGPEFIRRLTEEYGAMTDAQEIFQETCREFSAIYKSKAGAQASQEERVLDRFALVATAGRLASRLGVIPYCESEVLRAVMSCAGDHLARRGAGQGEDLGIVGKFRKFIIQHAQGSFLHLDQSIGDPNRAPTRSFGWSRDGVLYLTRETLAEALDVHPSSTRHAKALAAAGLLMTERDGDKTRLTVRATLHADVAARYYAVPYAAAVSGEAEAETVSTFELFDAACWPKLNDIGWLEREAELEAITAGKLSWQG
jgi:putative DNA primase/helicase